MEVTEIVEKHMEESDTDIPDNVIYIIFPEGTQQQLLPIDNLELNNFDQSSIPASQGILPSSELFSPDIISADTSINLKENENLELANLNCTLENNYRIDVETQTDFSNTSDKNVDVGKYSGRQDQSFLSNDIEDNILSVGDDHERMEELDVSLQSFLNCDKSSQISIETLNFEYECGLEGVIEKSSNASHSFTRPHNLLRHKETRHAEGEKKYVCEFCNRKFGRQDIFASHLRLIHGKNKSDSEDSDSVYQCSSCKKFFTKLHNYMKHQKGNLTCTKCSETFACKRSLRNHLNKRHSVTCSICGKMCPSKQQMYAHKLTHAPKFKCEYCGKGFVWESQFTVHLATHTGIRPLNCDICGNSFAHPNAVKKHKWQDHTEANKKHRCPVCGKGFVYKSKLNAHVRIHTGKKPFPCQRCSSYFSQKHNLAAHMKIVHGLVFKYLEEDDEEEEQVPKSKETAKCDEKAIKESTNESLTVETPSGEEQNENFQYFS
ncbi:Zinc finger and SCAN domain-containing protein 2 [Armadillidium nasatum]|uniref:Zinc finger and SCAN domain-containing protein 2 n=1 Tax=Armadillidium nasatum TaxID=96803 RepID=A0A5N5TJI3_9CRUS|nr:Zinc finger and SCAN domain-containing protein 2 [Armadillidium nasatum]